MPDDRPGFYSLTHVDPADDVVIRSPQPKNPVVLTSKEKQIALAISILEANGYTVIPPKEARPDGN